MDLFANEMALEFRCLHAGLRKTTAAMQAALKACTATPFDIFERALSALEFTNVSVAYYYCTLSYVDRVWTENRPLSSPHSLW